MKNVPGQKKLKVSLVFSLFFLLVLLPPAARAAYLSDNMEGASQWTNASPWAITAAVGHNATKAWSDSPAGYYAGNADVALTLTTAIPLTGATSPQLVFWHKYQLETDFDFGYVEISAEEGVWQAAKLATYTGISDWKREQIDLTAFAGQTVKIRFRLVTDKTIHWDGWYIDDLTVAEPPSAVPTFTVSNPQATSLDLTWSESLDSEWNNYKIFRSTTPDVSASSTLVTTITTKTTTTYKDQNLLPNTNYYYKIYVFTASDLASPSKDASNKTAIAQFAYPFEDGMEGSVGGWVAGAPWGLTSADKHSGSFAWTDSPAGAYTAGADTALQLSIDLGTAIMPVLSFWHRYNFDTNSDFGYLEVREVGTTTWKRIYFATGTLSAWTEKKIDLANYAGKKVDIRFRATADTNNNQADGWYIDDIKIAETPTLPLDYPFIDNMGTDANWFSSSWALTTDGRNGGLAFTDSLEGGYGTETDSSLIMVTTLKKLGNPGSHPQLSFWHKYDIYNNDSFYCNGWTSENDRGRVYLSTNKGQPGTWKELAAYSGAQSTWKKEQIDLSTWAGLPDVRIKFVMSDMKSGNGNCNSRPGGWTIDDVVIEDVPVDVSLSITASSMNAVSLSWTQNNDTDFDRYEIYRAAAPGVTRGSALVASVGTQATVSYMDTVAMVQPGTYYYRIWVVDKDGNTSLGSGEVQATYTVPVNNYPFTEDGEAGTAKWSWGAPWGLTETVKYEGTKAWAASTGNYPANADTSLATFLNLTGSTTPVLSFWHKYSLEEAKDFVRLEVSTDNGLTWTGLRTFTGTETAWNQERVNLTAYAGNAKLGLRFRLSSDDQNQQEGWYMDNLQIKEEAVRAGYPFTDDVEQSIAPWFYDSPWGIVQLDASQSRNPGVASKVWSDSPGSYAAGADSSLYLTLDLGAAQMPVLSFWHRYAFDANSDYGYIEVREGGSTSWKRLYFVTGTSPAWVEGKVDLSNYAGRQVDIRFRVAADANGTNSDGWYLDDLRIGETTAPAIAYPFIDIMETGSKWYSSSWSLVTDPKSGSWSFTDSAAGSYGAQTESELVLNNTLDLTNAIHPQLSFWHKYEIYNNDSFYCSGWTEEHDRARVYLSTNKGQPGTWKELAAYFGAQATWKREQIDLSAWAGIADVRIKFVMRDGASGNGNCNTRQPGWTIDDVAVEDAPVDINLTVSVSSMNSVTLSWTQNNNADFDHYEIYRSSATGVTRSDTLVYSNQTRDATTYTDIVALVQPGTYYYKMWVFDKDGNVSMGSGEAQATYAVPVNNYPFAEDGESGTAKWSWGAPWGLSETVKYEGTRAWATSTGNYPANANTSLTTFLNLTGSTTPVLTFWHKYSLEESKDFIRLEISTDNGQTWTALKSYTGTETAWNQERVNLTAYAGNAKLGLRFRLASDGQNQQEGWYMDNLQIKEETIRAGYPFADDMEQGIAPWFYDSPWGIVQLDASLSRNNVASKVWSDSPGSYASEADSSLYLTIDLGAAQMPVLSFWHRYAFDANSDYGYIEVREGGSQAWKRLYFITGASSSWLEGKVDLANYAGKQVDIRFRVTADANGTNSDGWYLDDIRIEETNAAALPYPFTESFEDPSFASRWIVSSWDKAADANTGTYGITDSVSGSYGSDVKTDLILGNIINLQGALRPQLTFWHKYEIYNNNSFYCSGWTEEHDYGLVLLSTNNGQPGTWKQIAAFQGNQATWRKEQISLNSWAGLPNVRIKFVMSDSTSYNGNCNTRQGGWTIDDVRIGEDETIPSYIVKVSGDDQTGQTEMQLAYPFVVKVSDSQSRAQAGIQVDFSVASGGGSLSTLTGTSDAAGLVSTKLTLGAASGVNTVTATIPNTTPLQTVTFTTTGYALNQAMTLAKASGDHQVYTKGLALPNPLVVKVTDISGNPVSGANVAFAKVSGEGTLSSTTPVLTGADGLASVSLTLGTATGMTTVSATVAGLRGSPQTFTAYAVLQGGSLGDTDGDSMPDAWETAHGLNPVDPADAALDADNDGLTNLAEYTRGTDPTQADTDHDGMPDKWEVQYGLNPLDPADAARDANGNGKTNLQEYLDQTVPVYQRHFTVARVTNESMVVYGLVSIEGVAAQPGDEVAAICPGNVVCGQFTLETAGQYGFMHIYKDDPLTAEKDGAAPGDLVTFRVWDASAGVELDTTAQVITGTNPPSWTFDGDIGNINLNAGGKQIIPLRAGWNLISFSVKNCYYVGDAVPAEPMLPGINYLRVGSIDQALASIAGKYEVVRSFDSEGAHTFVPSLPEFSNLKYLAAGYGYWIKMTEAANLELTGLKALASDSLAVHTGWNLVGYWANDVRYTGSRPTVSFPPDATAFTPLSSLGEAFSTLAGNYGVVRSFDAGGSHTYDPLLADNFNNLRYVGPGYGIWIRMKTRDDLSY